MNPRDNADAFPHALLPPRRNQFFYGKRMDVQHFQMEQEYGKEKQWLLNRLTLGKGVVCGLRVALDNGRICVDPGVAIDGLGREIVVPVRTCVDPSTLEDTCCGDHAASHATSQPHPEPTPRPDAERRGSGTGVFTLFLCYRECSADYQPVLVSDCDTREHCAAGTLVESFCFKVTPGLAPLQGDPSWCAKLWPPERRPDGTGDSDSEVFAGGTADAPSGSDSNREAIRAALQNRRHLLCELLDGPCPSSQGDPCVPLAAMMLSDGVVVRAESCLVRPRVYSNAMLLDMILCLARKVDECCKHDAPQADLMRVRSIDFVRLASPAGAEVVVASVTAPRGVTSVALDGKTNAIRIRFSKPFEREAHRPTTHASGDSNFKRHNVQVLPEPPLASAPFVPGSLTIEAPDTLRFDLSMNSPFSRGPDGWQTGRYRIFLRGTADPSAGGSPLADLSGAALDGEPIAPNAGVISGDGTAGGDFTTVFTVG